MPEWFRAIKCRVTFGVWPVVPWTDGHIQLFRQTVVDKELARRAYTFLRCCEEERGYRPVSLGESTRKLCEHEKRLQRAQARVRRSKRQFWAVVKLAKKCGFDTRSKASYYLDERLLPYVGQEMAAKLGWQEA